MERPLPFLVSFFATPTFRGRRWIAGETGRIPSISGTTSLQAREMLWESESKQKRYTVVECTRVNIGIDFCKSVSIHPFLLLRAIAVPLGG